MLSSRHSSRSGLMSRGKGAYCEGRTLISVVLTCGKASCNETDNSQHTTDHGCK